MLQITYRTFTIRALLLAGFISIGCGRACAQKSQLLPEFYARAPRHIKDTTWQFECYDSRDSLMNIDTVQDISEVKYVSLFKSYTDSAHTYIDSNGKKQLLPVSSIIQRFDRAGQNKWLSVDYARNKYIELKEFREDIVRTDTAVITDPISGNKQTRLLRYYKVAPVK